MKKFEYLQIKSYNILDDNRIDRIGKEGYELASMVFHVPENDRYKTEVYVYVFKRELKVSLWKRAKSWFKFGKQKNKS